MELLFVFAFAFIPFAIVFSAIAIISKVLQKRARIPFEYSDMGRIPAFSLIQSQKDHTFNMVTYTMLSCIYFQLPFSIPTLSEFLGFENIAKNWWSYLVILFIAAFYSLVKAVGEFSRLRNIRLGIEAEWAVSYALSKITDRNVRVFHDIQGTSFNIDHVVTYPGGVLAIETKGRRKPNIKDAKDSYKLTVEGDKIHFPHFTDTSTVEQAKRQAVWLSKELTQSTGMDIITSPISGNSWLVY